MDPDPFIFLYKNHEYRLKLDFCIPIVHSRNSRTFSRAIKCELDKLKYTFFPDLNGFIMGFGKVISKETVQADVSQYINVSVNIDVYIFKPPVGSILEAVVSQTSNNQVSCLVQNVFNVSLVQPEQLLYDQWPGSIIKKDDKIIVRILSYELTNELPRITAEIVNKDSKCCEPKNEQENVSFQYSSEESVSNFNKSSKRLKKNSTTLSKHMSSNSGSSFEMPTTISHLKNYDDVSNKTSPLFSQIFVSNGKNVRNELFSSTPIFNIEQKIHNINSVRNKCLEQLQIQSVRKLTNKQLNEFEKNNSFQCSNIFDVRNNINNEFNTPSQASSNNTYSTNEINEIASMQSDSGISEDEHKKKKSVILRYFSMPVSIKINQKSPKSIKTNPNSIQSESINYNCSKGEKNTASHNLITSVEDNSIYTQHLHDSIEETLNKSVNNLSKPSIKSSSSNTKKGNAFKTNDKEDCKNQIENSIINKQLATLPSYSECSSNKHAESSVKNQLKNEYKEIENYKSDNMVACEIQYMNSSDSDNYTKHIHDISEPFTKKTNNCEIYFSDGYDSSSNFVHDASTSYSKLIKSNPQVNLSNIFKTDNCNLNNRSNLSSKKKKLKKKKKREIKKSTIFKSPKFNKSSTNLVKNKNIKNELIKQILKEDPSSSYDENLECKHPLFKETSQKASKKIPISNVLNSKKKTGTIINKDIADPFNTLFTSSSSENEESISKSNKTDHFSDKKNTILKKNNLIKQILTSMKNKDKKHKQSLLIEDVNANSSKNNNKFKKVKDDLKISKSKKDKSKIENKAITNPFIKLYVDEFTSTSSEDEELISKSNKVNYYSNKEKTIVEKKKNNLIKQILASIKNENKHSLSNENVNSNSSEETNKLRKVQNILKINNSKQDKLKIKNKKQSKTLFHVFKEDNLSHNKILSFTDDSTDEDIEFKKQKINKNINDKVPKLTLKNNSCIKLNKQSKITKKLQNTSRIKPDKLPGKNITKRKSLRISNNLLIDNIINSIQDSSSDHI